MSLAGVEAVKAKRVLGALRALWRSSKEKGNDAKLTHLKSFLRNSPQQQGRKRKAPEPGPLREDEPEANNVASDPVSDGSLSDEAASDPPSPDQAKSPVKSEVKGDSSGDESDGPSSADSLTARTLVLGEEGSSSDEDEDMRDSQVSSGWMGKAFNHCFHEQIAEEQKKRQNWEVLMDIRFALSCKLGEKLVGPNWDLYASFCVQALNDQGEDVREELANIEYFTSWCNSLHQDTESNNTKRGQEDTFVFLTSLGSFCHFVTNQPKPSRDGRRFSLHAIQVH